MTETAPPPSRITVKIGEAAVDKTVFMSFAMLNELTPLVGGPERMAEFDFDARLREHTLKVLLAERDAQRKIPEEYMLPEDLDMETAEVLMDWAKDHVLNFFIRRLMKNISEFEKNTDALRMAEKLPRPTG